MTEKEALLSRIRELSFTLDDIRLFLCTHPCDRDAFCCYRQIRDLEQEAMKEYTCRFGPLTADNVQDDNAWTWVRDPWPWEGEV